MTPVAASDKKNESIVFMNLHGKHAPRWTEEIFTVSRIQYTDPITYKITDVNGEDIQGTFYEQELQKTTQKIFRIEKIIRKRGNKYLVKWLGYILIHFTRGLMLNLLCNCK
jgi:hypothetical protein